MHTIKAGCGFAELPGLEAVAHDSEEILARIRKRRGKSHPWENLSFVMHAVVLIKTIVRLWNKNNMMKTEPRPISDAWRIIPAAVHDLENRLNKKIALQMVGGELQVN